jgi:hypothetical protein
MENTARKRMSRLASYGGRILPRFALLPALGSVTALAVILVLSGCQDSGTASAAQQRSPRPPAKGYLPPDAANAFTLEFDAAEDMLQRRPDGSFVVTAFQVGFFDGPTLVRALEIPRSAAEFSGTRVRLRVPLIPLAAGSRSSVDIRVRGLSTGPLGQWSASAGSVTLPVQARAERANRRARDSANAERRRPDGSSRADGSGRAVTLEQLNEAPALKQALTPLLRGASEADTAAACTTIPDLATAVVLSRKHDLPLPPLCAALRERGNSALADALKASKPSIDVTREIKAARAEARTLFRGGGQRNRQKPATQP